jgi:hypothetical protein
MKSKIFTCSFLLIAASLSAQQTTSGEKFTRINIMGNAKIFVKQDAACTIRYTGNDNASDAIASVKNGTLNIDGSPDNEINVTLPVLNEIDIDGNGSVTGVSTFNADDLKLKIGGDGKIVLDVIVKKIFADISGVGKMTLSGSAEDATLTIPGSGKIDAMGMKTNRASVNISGVGKCLVDAVDELNSNVSGSGNVYYKSLPKSRTDNVSGIGSVKNINDDNVSSSGNSSMDTTRFTMGENQIWIIGKKDIIQQRRHRVKPIWAGFEMGLNSYVNNDGSFTMEGGLKNWDLRLEKSIYVGLNVVQTQVELGKSNVWLFTGLGISWNSYRFASDVYLENGPVTIAKIDSTPNVGHLKSKLVAVYLNAPVMFEVFTSNNIKKAVHIGAGGIFGVRLGSHTKQKIEVDGDASKLKTFDDFNLVPFRYGFRIAVGYGKFNLFADYYASTMFKDQKGPALYPVNAGITFIGF